MPSLNLEPQDYGRPKKKVHQPHVETVDAGHPNNIPAVDDDVQSDPALSVYPAADWADEGGAISDPNK